MKCIRNFSIIAHVDHGKSTLSDRFIQICGGLNAREMKSQVLDSMELERERGITIKSQSVTLDYISRNGKRYQLNLIDTPGHVDFSSEVSRSLAACEGALLVVDVTQGIEAQTIANYRVATEMNLKIIVVLNKVDILTANVDRVSKEIQNLVGVNTYHIAPCSAKTGFGVLNLLERLIEDIPSPRGDASAPLQALIIDSWFDNYLGIISLICIKNGELRKGDVLRSMSTGQKCVAEQIGIFTPKKIKRMILNCGEVGWVACAIKNIIDVPVGDTLTLLTRPAITACPGFKKIQPYVYAGLFPVKPITHKIFQNALYRLSLNDSSLFYEPERSEFLGLGFRCGFLGMLHMEIIQERLKREYALELIITTPMVRYEVVTANDQVVVIDNPSKLLSLTKIKSIREPIASCNILLPKEYLGSIITLCTEKRGSRIVITYLDNRVTLSCDLPMSEVMLDFFNYLQSASSGYASCEYKFDHFQVSDIVCVEILINGHRIDALAIMIHRKVAMYRARILINKLKSLIPRQQFDIVVQAVIGNRVICRDTVKQLRKNVIAKCYGGDITRKKKLLYNQKKGKKIMKKVGRVNLPNTVFLSILSEKISNKNR